MPKKFPEPGEVRFRERKALFLGQIYPPCRPKPQHLPHGDGHVAGGLLRQSKDHHHQRCIGEGAELAGVGQGDQQHPQIAQSQRPDKGRFSGPQQGDTIPHQHAVGGNAHQTHAAHDLGDAVVALTLDESGIPLLAEQRFAVAEKIVRRAEQYGIPKEDIFVDCLTLTASAQQKEVVETLKAMKMVKEKLGVKTVLGVSNISFGLPNRELLNHSFLLMALQAGLDLPIINPNIPSMLDAIRAFEVLYNLDEHSARYIENFSRPEEIARISAKPVAAPISAPESASAETGHDPLTDGIKKGLAESVRREVAALLTSQEPEEIINTKLIPALDVVGQEFEQGKIFLPQMIQSAQAAQAGFEEIKNFLANHPKADTPSLSLAQKGIVLATVHGDVHDIGKNIVKVILENYGFPVLDLGRDVPAQKVVAAVKEHYIKLVGLSALMTTTLKSMEETIAALRAENLDCKVMVGGAVLTEDYAMKIGADFYAKDAKQSVDIAKKVLG